MKFVYSGLCNAGRREFGEFEAVDRKEAISELLESGLKNIVLNGTFVVESYATTDSCQKTHILNIPDVPPLKQQESHNLQCPICKSRLKVTAGSIGQKRKCPTCLNVLRIAKQTIDQETNTEYGLCVQNPVLCGGGPLGEHSYLNRLRCPESTRIHWERLGSGSKKEEDLPIDVYKVICDCRRHRAFIYMDMYHTEPDGITRCIGLSGWSIDPECDSQV